MIALNLEVKCVEHQILKDYLEQNASEVLADKINNGIKIQKDGKSLISKKDLDGFMSYANSEAQKLAEKEARFACVKSDTVFGWAIHYFEEDSIKGKLFNEDGTEYKPPKPMVNKAASYVPPAPKPKPQISIFDLMDTSISEKPDPAKTTKAEPEDAVEPESVQAKITNTEFEPEPEHTAAGKPETDTAEIAGPQADKPDELIQVSENQYIDKNVVVYEAEEVTARTENTELDALSCIFGDILKTEVNV